MILVTGGAGYIGSHTVKLLLEKGEKVTVLDNLFRGYKEVIGTLQEEYGKENLVFYEADLRNKEELTRIIFEIKPEAIMHFAALCLVNESTEEPELYFENNVCGSLNLLSVAKKVGVKFFVFSSTSEVYGEAKYLPVDEKHPLSAVNPYGRSKLMVEEMLPFFSPIAYVIFRYFNVTGAADDGLIGDSKRPSQLLVQNAVRGALGMDQFKLTCPKVETRDSSPVRDYVDVLDLALAHVMALDYLRKNGKSDVFNLGTGKGSSVLEVVEEVKKITGVNFEIGQAEPRKGEVAEKYADYSKAEKILGWRPERSLKDSVEALVKWYKRKPEGWKKN